ncbi:MAG: TauD/TfdA family dioxygenase [Rhodothermia bacterium]|nr:TauD/TfdA family dioxygenase [Rhodothermia bacterium]
MNERLRSDGAILFHDVGVSDARSFEEFAGRHISEWMGYQDRATKRGHIEGHVHTSTDTSPAFSIALHCESSFTSRWPQKIFFYCHSAPTSGGRTPICDVRCVYRDIDPGIRAKFERLGVMYFRNFGKGVGMDWREVFQKADRQSVDAYCASHAIHTEWLDDDRLRTIQVRPATLMHPIVGQTVWFNHALALHKSSLADSLMKTLMRQRGESYLPHNAYYGSG